MYCNSPFVNVVIHPDEIVEYGCCTIFEPIEKTREDIVNNNISDICKLCESKDLFYGLKYQAEINKKILEKNKNDLLIEELNISICNECNLRCITCQLDHTKKDKIQLKDIKYKKCNNLLIQGGEPFLYEDILLDIIKNINFNNLTIITNGMVIKSKILEYINSVVKKNVYIIFSIDGIGRTNDYIRCNSDFNTLTTNIKYTIINYSNIKYSINFTVNVLNIINIVQNLIDLYNLFSIKINLNLLFDPEELNIRNIDKQLKNKILINIIRNMKKIREITTCDSVERLIKVLYKRQTYDIYNSNKLKKLLNKHFEENNIDYSQYLDKETIMYLKTII